MIVQRDPREAAVTAQQERLAGLPPREMLSRVEAMAKVDAYFAKSARRSGLRVSVRTPNRALVVRGTNLRCLPSPT